MAKPKIKYIVFDLGGVIMSGGFLPFVKNFCVECLTKEGKKKLAALERRVNLGQITEKEFYQAINKTFHLRLSPRLMHRLITRKMQTNKELLHLIPELKPAKIALFSNSIGHMATHILHERHFPIRQTFDKVFVSEKIHLAKPDGKAYGYILKKLKAKPEEALMVDDRAANIKAAKAMGMHGIVFKNTEQFKKAIKKYEIV